MDEAHHLRSEWWKVLEQLLKEETVEHVISLTATPPYDSTPEQWQRYMDLCGPIDVEIFSPELVQEGSLCPHQDYIYFSYPTPEESKSIDEFRVNAKKCAKEMMALSYFRSIVTSHRGLIELKSFDFLEDPKHFTSWLVVMNHLDIPYPHYLNQLIGKKRDLPSFKLEWFETFLQGLLFSHREDYVIKDEQYKEMCFKLKSYGCLERNQVALTSFKGLAKMLAGSKSKFQAILEITKHEYKNLNQNLRLLILCDFIKKEQLIHIDNLQMEMLQIGAVPIFECIRRDAINNLKVAVLSGSLVIIPQTALSAFQSILCHQEVNIIPINDEQYVRIDIVGDHHKMVQTITELFNQGYIHVLIGTKSLLGEGWDSPCVNAMIMATFVGSFMLSNQMRGRAIRTDVNHPEKVSHIWHLACVQKPDDASFLSQLGVSEDYLTIERRFKSFLGLHYHQPIIESGIQRVDVIKQPFTKSSIKSMNHKMLEMSSQRQQLASRWHEALTMVDPSFEVNESVAILNQAVPTKFGYVDFIVLLMISVVVSLCLLLLESVLRVSLLSKQYAISIVAMVLRMLFSLTLTSLSLFVYRKLTPKKRMLTLANGIKQALVDQGELSTHTHVSLSDHQGVFLILELQSATLREQTLFVECLQTFFGEIDNPRYFLMRGLFSSEYYALPDCFSKRKEEALRFTKTINQSRLGYKLIYSRNPKGRKILLKARAKSYINRNQRMMDRKKKVKSRFE